MTTIVWVTSAQVAAARLIAKRAEAKGKPVPFEVLAIANAKRASNGATDPVGAATGSDAAEETQT